MDRPVGLVGDTIGRLTTAGVFTDEFNIPRGGGPEPLGITTGPDGALWFTEYAAFRIGTVTTSGVFTEFLLPGVSPTGNGGFTGSGILSEPYAITAGPDGALWFTESASNSIGRAVISSGPTITMVQNNYSFILPNAPNYGIAPGSLILISGAGMAAPGSSSIPLQDPTKALPTILNGASVSVTVGGVTVHPAFYYATPNYLAVVLPSTTPVGSGTITVSYGRQTSAAVPIEIVAHAFGFDYYAGALAGITDNLTNSPRPGHLITASYSAHAGRDRHLLGFRRWRRHEQRRCEPASTLR
jgi:hypothetical protein